MPLPKLRVDRREKPPTLVKTIRTIVGEDNTELATLPCADYAVGTVVGIERKKIGNLLSSMTTKMADGSIELWDQLARCVNHYDNTYLIVEGDLDPVANPKMSIADGRSRGVGYLAVQATIEKVQMQGIRVLQTRSEIGTALVLRWLWKKYLPMVQAQERAA